MKTKISHHNVKSALLAASLATLLAVSVFTETASAQGRSKKARRDAQSQAQPKNARAQSAGTATAVLPDATTAASNYVFSTATNASLTDMSGGTIQLLGPNTNDVASALTSIGFDFFFQGNVFAQFSI